MNTPINKFRLSSSRKKSKKPLEDWTPCDRKNNGFLRMETENDYLTQPLSLQPFFTYNNMIIWAKIALRIEPINDVFFVTGNNSANLKYVLFDANPLNYSICEGNGNLLTPSQNLNGIGYITGNGAYPRLDFFHGLVYDDIGDYRLCEFIFNTGRNQYNFQENLFNRENFNSISNCNLNASISEIASGYYRNNNILAYYPDVHKRKFNSPSNTREMLIFEMIIFNPLIDVTDVEMLANINSANYFNYIQLTPFINSLNPISHFVVDGNGDFVDLLGVNSPYVKNGNVTKIVI